MEDRPKVVNAVDDPADRTGKCHVPRWGGISAVLSARKKSLRPGEGRCGLPLSICSASLALLRLNESVVPFLWQTAALRPPFSDGVAAGRQTAAPCPVSFRWRRSTEPPLRSRTSSSVKESGADSEHRRVHGGWFTAWRRRL
jgi:hypothetical protein